MLERSHRSDASVCPASARWAAARLSLVCLNAGLDSKVAMASWRYFSTSPAAESAADLAASKAARASAARSV